MTKREQDFDLAWAQIKAAEAKAKRRKSRWGGDIAEKAFIPGMPTVIPQGMSKDQEEMYLIQLQIEEISRKLRTGDLGIPLNPEERSPSPEPIYNSEGKRLNTREYRTRKRLEEDRHVLVTQAFKINPEYKAPPDYKPPVIRVSDKVMIPQEEHPDINFVGLLIGPRGNTLKNLEKETGAKIIIRGKGSVKEGKIGRKDGQPLPGEDEPLHAYVTANNPENVKKAVEKIKEIIRQGIEVPEGQNDLRRQQLRELALLNGTLRENDGLSKLKQIQQAQSIITNTIICSVCGGTGHIAQDCKQKRPGESFHDMPPPQTPVDKAKMDSEYMSLMAELGEGPPPPKTNSNAPYMAPRPFSVNVERLALPPPSQPQPQMPGQPPQMRGQNPPRTFTTQPPRTFTSQPPPMVRSNHMQNAFCDNNHKQNFRDYGDGPPRFHGHGEPHHHHHPPHPHNMAAPWQQGPPGQQQQQKPPPNMMQPPMSSQPPQMVPPAQPTNTSAPMQPPPWQQNMPPNMQPPPHTVQSNMGVPPPGLLAPPPPPPSSQPPQFPWQQQQSQQSMPGMPMPPPPPPHIAGGPPPWQQGGVGPVPPPPPGSLPPWQQGPPAPVPPVSHHGVPPPPPPGAQGFNPGAPPPPPPTSQEQMAMGMPGIPLGVPPPPPPN